MAPAGTVARSGDGRRPLGLTVATALVVGNIIGVGIFVLPAALAPYGLNAIFGWLLAALGCALLAWVFAGLAHRLPDADGPYDYVAGTLGGRVAHLALWSYWVSVCLTNVALATGTTGYLVNAVPALDRVPPAAVALCILWLLAGVNMLGIRAGGRTQVATVALKLVPLLAIMGLAAALLVTAPAAYARAIPATPISAGAVMGASTLALFAIMGVETASIPAARIRDPARTIPRATLIGMAVVVVIYVVVSTIPMLLIDQRQLGQLSAPFVVAAERLGSPLTAHWLAVFVVVSGLGCLNGWTLVTGELTRTMARRGSLLAWLGRGNAAGTPIRAYLATGVIDSVLVLATYQKSLVDTFALVTRAVTLADMPLYVACALALVVIGRREPYATRFRLPWLPVAAIAYVAVVFVGAGWRLSVLAIVVCASGWPLYRPRAAGQRVPR